MCEMAILQIISNIRGRLLDLQKQIAQAEPGLLRQALESESAFLVDILNQMK